MPPLVSNSMNKQLAKNLKKIYKIDRALAQEASAVLGYEIKPCRKIKARQTLDQVVNYLTQQLFQYINELSNKQGYRFKASADEFQKQIQNFLTSKLR